MPVTESCGQLIGVSMEMLCIARCLKSSPGYAHTFQSRQSNYRKPPASSQISKFFTSASTSNDSTSQPTSQHEVTEVQAPIHVDAAPSQSDTCDTTNSRSDVRSTTSRSPKSTRSNQSRLGQMPINTKASIKSFFANDDSLSDFEIPEKIMRKAPTKRPPKAKTKGTRSRAKQADIRKAINSRAAAESAVAAMTEDEQLEMALALSRNDHAVGIQSHLEAFRNPAAAAKSTPAVAGLFRMKRKATARHKWNSRCTQLTRRDEHAQAKRVRDKVDEILVNNISVESSTARNQNADAMYIIYSEQLQRVCVPEQHLYGINGTAMATGAEIRSYYTNNLVEPSGLRAGVLLKHWSDIPGRDAIYDDTRFSARQRQRAGSIPEPIELIDDEIEPLSGAPTEPLPSPTDSQPNHYRGDGDEIYAAAVVMDLAPVAMEIDQSSAMCDSWQKSSLSSVETTEAQPITPIEEIESQTQQGPAHQREVFAATMDRETGTGAAATSECDNIESNEADDNDRTVALDGIDIQLTVDTLNAELRASEQFVGDEHAIVVNIPVTACRSPDLFADEDFFDSDPENRKFVDQFIDIR